jgi:predicted alpha/beta hydrolase family esterase
MKQVLFVQGGGECAHEADASLAASLRRELGAGYDVRYPLMPNEDSPDYSAWADALEGEAATLGPGAILVGHSVGGTVLARFLAERPPRQRIAGIFLLAAPFVGDGGWQIEGSETPHDLAARLPSNIPVHLYHGRNDEIVPFAHVGLYARVLPAAKVHPLEGRDHQLGDDLAEVARDIAALDEQG